MNDRRRALGPFAYPRQEPLDPDPWAQDDELAYGGSSADPALDDYNAQRREWRDEAGAGELEDPQYGGGPYAVGPFESSDEIGPDDFRRDLGRFGELDREFELRSVRQWRRPQDDFRSRPGSDPAGGFRTFRPPVPVVARGPKNYRRPDERILEDVYLRLLRDPAIDSSDVSIEVHRGVATLVGTVPTRHMKHEIEDAVYAIPGIEDIDNRIKVNSGPLAPG
jgi:hypothetical protein